MKILNPDEIYQNYISAGGFFFFFLVSNEAMLVGGSTLQMHFVWPVRDGSSFSVV